MKTLEKMSRIWAETGTEHEELRDYHTESWSVLTLVISYSSYKMNELANSFSRSALYHPWNPCLGRIITREGKIVDPILQTVTFLLPYLQTITFLTSLSHLQAVRSYQHLGRISLQPDREVATFYRYILVVAGNRGLSLLTILEKLPSTIFFDNLSLLVSTSPINPFSFPI